MYHPVRREASRGETQKVNQLAKQHRGAASASTEEELVIFWTFLASAVAENRVVSPLTEIADSITGFDTVGIIIVARPSVSTASSRRFARHRG